MNTGTRICEEIWRDLMNCGGYNSEVDEDIVKVMRLIKNEREIFYTEIAIKLNLKPSHVELIQYIICSLNMADYGTSPRGCWLTEKGEGLLDIFERRLSPDKDTMP